MDIGALSPGQRSRFTRWRWSVYLSMFVGWSCHMLIRRNLPSTVTSLMQHQGFSRNEIGMITSSFAFSYGISKFLGSIISDHASPQKVFSCGLVLAGLCSLAFPLTTSITLACVVWFTEGLMQGFGWPPCVILLKSWYPTSHIGRWWSFLSSAGNIVSACLPLLVVFITSISEWSMTYYLFGLCGFSTGIMVLFTIKDSPEEIGLTSFHSSSKKKTDDDNLENGDSREPVRESWYAVFFIFNLWLVSLVYIILYVFSHSMLNWTQLYLIQSIGMSKTKAAACYSMYQVGGIIGNLTSGLFSDLFVTPRTVKCPCPRAPFLLVLGVFMAMTLHLFRTTVDTQSSETWVSAVVFVLGYCIASSVAVIGLSAMEVVPAHMVGSAHGLACAVAQVGGFVAGWPFSVLVEWYSWNMAYAAVELLLILMVFITSYLVFLLVSRLRKTKVT